MVVYRNSSRGVKYNAEEDHRYGETGTGDDSKEQHEADSKWWIIAATRRPYLKASSTSQTASSPASVASTRAAPGPSTRTIAATSKPPSPAPLTDQQIKQRMPTLGMHVGDPRPHIQGKIREYLPL